MARVFGLNNLAGAITPDLLTDRDVRKVLLIKTAESALRDAQREGHLKRGQFQTVVDGAPRRFVQRVRAGGRISFVDNQTSFVSRAYQFALARLLDYSPVRSGQFKRSFQSYAIPTGASINLTRGGLSTGRRIDFPSQIQGDEVLVVNVQPYGAKLERGYSDQARAGLFQKVYRELLVKYGASISVSFIYAQGYAKYRGQFYAAPALRIGPAGAFRTRASNPNSRRNRRRRR